MTFTKNGLAPPTNSNNAAAAKFCPRIEKVAPSVWNAEAVPGSGNTPPLFTVCAAEELNVTTHGQVIRWGVVDAVFISKIGSAVVMSMTPGAFNDPMRHGFIPTGSENGANPSSTMKKALGKIGRLTASSTPKVLLSTMI